MSDENAPKWWTNATVYQVYIRSFADSDGDGLGDMPGITSRLPYLKDLGIDAVWITPFYPSPQHDAGYDVSDYVDVDPRFGTLADFDAMLATAHELGLRIIVDLVPNHTSWDHEWFQEAVVAPPGSPSRERYIFRDGRGPDGSEPPNNWRSVFGGPAWDRLDDGQWYLHIFDRSQPDLNWRDPQVGDMFEDVLRFWLDKGVDGFRVDVAHGLVKEESLRDQIVAPGQEPSSNAPTTISSSEQADPAGGPAGGPAGDPVERADSGLMIDRDLADEPMWDQPEVHDVYRRWRLILDSYPGDRMAVGEAWAPTVEAMARYIRPDELPQTFNFEWLLAPWSAQAFTDVITHTLAAVGTVGASPTWVLSNHDVTRHATRYGGGELGLARARAATLTMLALPGSSYLYQGEELGLEEVDVAPEFRQDPAYLRTGKAGRDGCRVPLPWSGDSPSYGFGPSDQQPWLPQPEGWGERSVAAEEHDPDSTLSFYRAALSVRHTFCDTAGPSVEILDAPDGVLLFRRGDILCQINCGAQPTRLPDGTVLIASGPVPGAPDTATWLRG